MIIRISGDNFEPSEELLRYARKKIDGLTRFLPRPDRATAVIEVEFSEEAGGVSKTCQLTCKFKREAFTVRESTQHLYASLDVAVEDIQQRLRSFRKSNPGRITKYLRHRVDR